jgi:hypothetical protein
MTTRLCYWHPDYIPPPPLFNVSGDTVNPLPPEIIKPVRNYRYGLSQSLVNFSVDSYFSESALSPPKPRLDA